MVYTWIGLASGTLVIALLIRWLRHLFGVRLSIQLPAFSARFKQFVPLPFSALLIALFLGATRFQLTRPNITPEHIAWYDDRPQIYAITGRLVAYPDLRDRYTLLRVNVEQLTSLADQSTHVVHGLLLARTPAGGDWRYGDQVRLQGYLQTPFESEEFSYRDYLAHQGVYAYFTCGFGNPETCAQLLQRGGGNPLRAAVYNLRQNAVQVVFRIFPDPEAALMAGILLGVETGIPESVQQAFNDTGTTHIIAISGFNFAIVAALFVALFGRLLGRWRGMVAAFLGIALYAALAGATAGVVRAAIMGGLSVFAVQIGRRQNGLNSLAFVAALMAFADPHVLWDVGFQLSFMATLGLILYADSLSRAFIGFAGSHLPGATAQRLAAPIGEYFLFTLAAQLTTLPLILYYFHRLSLISLLANPLVLPAQPPVMILGGLATLLGLLYLPLGQLAAYLAWPFVVYTIRIVELLATWQGAAFDVGQVSLWAVLAFYALLFAWTAFGSRLSAWLARRFPSTPSKIAWAALVALALLSVVTWQMALATPDGQLHLTLLDVGSGDGLLVQTPSGRYLLVDGGASPNALSDALGRRLPIGRRQLDYLVVAAAGEEHLAALPRAILRFPPGDVLWAGLPAREYNARLLSQALSDARVPVLKAIPGQSLDLGGGASLHVLTAGNSGSILSLEMGNFRAMLPIGLISRDQVALLRDPSLAPVTALLLADSGSAELNPPGWITRLQPQVILLSVGAGDRYGRPDPETLQAAQGYTLLRTDQNGWIELSTDGENMWVEIERK
jgi:competence protein ComEC